MSEAILVLNAGSSSIKFALFAHAAGLASAPFLHGQIDGIGAEPRLKARDGKARILADEVLAISGGGQHHQALMALLEWIDAHDDDAELVAAGHRVVHGGDKFSEPMLLDATLLAELDGFVPLAPLHQPHNLDAIRALAAIRPSLPQVACFDTAFHRTQPPVAQAFALPRAISAEGVRRYGFHGLSYEYIAGVLPEVAGERAGGRVVVAHLGNGASMCAMVGGRSIGSTMGFTAVDGLMMGTRTGNLDPGVLLYLMQNKGMGVVELTRLLYQESGLLGVSGLSQDMRTLLASDKPEAAEAVELFCYRIVRELGSLAAACAGLDALVFTGGIGEHAAEVRARVCRAAAWLGLELDPAANRDNAICISTPTSRVGVYVIPTNEEFMIARHTLDIIRARPRAAAQG